MRHRTVSVALVFLLTCSLRGQNVVTDWARIVQPAVSTPPKAPAYQLVLRAIIQIAVYDSAVAIEGGYSPFAAKIEASHWADVRAAVATAAWRAARARVDASQIPYLDMQYAAYISRIANSQAKLDGIRVGETAAAAILAKWANDGFSKVVLYQCSSDPAPPGEFEPDGGCATQPVGANVGQIEPFTFHDQSQFRPGGPDPLRSVAYFGDFTETKDYGRSNSTVRTPEQTDIAYFWQAVDTHEGLVRLAIEHSLNVRDAARFLAMVYTAAADANIAGFEAKYFYRSWRPRKAIPRAETDDNPDTDPDSTWTPLISVNHPEYPSAHSFSSTAITDTIARFFGTSKISWTLTANKAAFPKLVQTERTYADLNALMHEIYDARVWAGLHWRNSVLDGAKIGREVSDHVCSHYFRRRE
jgi:PAP2 superfamily